MTGSNEEPNKKAISSMQMEYLEAQEIISRLKQLYPTMRFPAPLEGEIIRLTKEVLQEEKQKEHEVLSPAEIKEYFGHITFLRIDLFLIQTRTSGKCGYCETWKAHPYERYYFQHLGELIHLTEDIVMIREILCDWNALHTTTYIDPITRRKESYPPELTEEGRHYLAAIGKGVNAFPAIYIKVGSNKLDKGKYKEKVFQGLGDFVKKNILFEFNQIKYQLTTYTKDARLVAPILRYLRWLDPRAAEFKQHEGANEFFRQYHRQGNLIHN